MENTDNAEKTGFAGFAFKRIAIVIVLVVAGLWGFIQIMDMFKGHSASQTDQTAQTGQISHGVVDTAHEEALPHQDPEEVHAMQAPGTEKSHKTGYAQTLTSSHGATHEKAPAAEQPDHSVHGDGSGTLRPRGVVFVEAVIKPIRHELNERFWGWRPNDLIKFTDNVNNFQLGVLEVTRRTSVILAERISRTGATAAFDPNLEQAMNWFMIKADRYILPSAETKYREGITELNAYLEKLNAGTASFYTRNDNLIPLLAAYEDLLGSCEENLVKDHEENGDPISHFMADNYFYYAKGVASALATILTAVQEEFAVTVEARRGTDVLHHVVEACERAIDINPIYITNASLDGFLANHRANMAAPISHARFYLGVLIKTLST